mgnify:CR=1 FL=1
MVSGHGGSPGQDWDFVSGDYVYILEKAGAIPVLIPQYGDLEAAKPFLEQLDGVLISGGHDVGPERYGAFQKGTAERSCPCGMSRILRFPDIL